MSVITQNIKPSFLHNFEVSLKEITVYLLTGFAQKAGIVGNKGETLTNDIIAQELETMEVYGDDYIFTTRLGANVALTRKKKRDLLNGYRTYAKKHAPEAFAAYKEARKQHLENLAKEQTRKEGDVALQAILNKQDRAIMQI